MALNDNGRLLLHYNGGKVAPADLLSSPCRPGLCRSDLRNWLGGKPRPRPSLETETAPVSVSVWLLLLSMLANVGDANQEPAGPDERASAASPPAKTPAWDSIFQW